MKVSDKFISKWSDVVIRTLILFAVTYTCIMFLHVESHHTKMLQNQDVIMQNNFYISNFLTNYYEKMMDRQIELRKTQGNFMKNQETGQKISATNQILLKEVLKNQGVTNVPGVY